MTTSQMTAEGSNSDRRRWERFTFSETTTAVLHADGQGIPCTLEDLSVGGVLLRAPDAVPATDRIELRHPVAGTFPLRRVWHKDGRYGFNFNFTEQTRQHILQCIALLLHPDQSGERAA